MLKMSSRIVSILTIAALISSCTFYESRQVSFRPPDQYANNQFVAGANIAAESYGQSARAKEVFGFDIRGAGLMPVQVVIDNRGGSRLELVPDQTFLVDSAGNYWNLLDRRTAYQRVEKSSEFGTIAKGAGRTAFLGAAAGALVGLAIGVLGRGNVAEDIGRGAVVGAAGGAIAGGAEAGSSGDSGRQIARDLANKELVNRVVEPGTMAHGFLFFPGEAPDGGQLKIQLRDVDTGKYFQAMLIL
jgi:hypothetical protein